ncbi:3-oxoadipate enol-lactonase [Paenibacillus sp. V4I3]|uniref:alpha/beta fold hydrolase n=1 Tax=Paenibacillus sp. V4I3 TaxID=3042305 RepID=UPI00278A3422|nr:alpha/beta hydrolase [Paenibacillus sp. V4I3]MDQ0874575.1 3-oxoadipate enol-lactonase [Paenibacillus sp. V4I3]
MNNREILSGRLDIGGKELHYEVSGAGPAVVLLHGHSVDRRMWDAQFASLATRYQVLRYDLRGYGLSDMPQEGEAYLHAEDLYKVINHLGIKQAHIVGLSLGAFVALDFLYLHPDHVMTVSVASGAIYANEEDESVNNDPFQDADSAHESQSSRPGRNDPAIQEKVDEWFINLMDSCGKYKDEIRDQLWKMIGDWSAWTLRHREPKCLIGPDLARGLRTNVVRTPILVIIGGDDSEGSIRSSEKLLALVPSARRADIADAGHFSNMERPEVFTNVLEHFFEEQRQ